MILTDTAGQNGLPRYFTQVFGMARDMNNGRIDFVMPDGRTFRADGKNPGPVAELRIHNPDLFARLIREGDMGFCEAYLDGWWSTPDLMSFMELVHADNEDIYDGFPGMGLVRLYENLRFWWQSNSKRQAKKNISYHYDLGNDFYQLWLDDTMTYSSAKFETGQESLERAQELKYASTIVVIWGDHGWFLGDMQMWGKHSAFEEALRSVLMVRIPGVSPQKSAA